MLFFPAAASCLPIVAAHLLVVAPLELRQVEREDGLGLTHSAHLKNLLTW